MREFVIVECRKTLKSFCTISLIHYLIVSFQAMTFEPPSSCSRHSGPMRNGKQRIILNQTPTSWLEPKRWGGFEWTGSPSCLRRRPCATRPQRPQLQHIPGLQQRTPSTICVLFVRARRAASCCSRVATSPSAKAATRALSSVLFAERLFAELYEPFRYMISDL